MNPIIGYAGMTHLGLNSAAASVAHDFETVGFDPDSDRIAQLQKGVIPCQRARVTRSFDCACQEAHVLVASLSRSRNVMWCIFQPMWRLIMKGKAI